MTKNEPCHAMVLKTRKTVIIFQLEGRAVTCLKVPALSSDILTKVRELSQLQFHYKLHENTKMLHLIQQTCKIAVCAQAEQPCRL